MQSFLKDLFNIGLPRIEADSKSLKDQWQINQKNSPKSLEIKWERESLIFDVPMDLREQPPCIINLCIP